MGNAFMAVTIAWIGSDCLFKLLKNVTFKKKIVGVSQKTNIYRLNSELRVSRILNLES